MTDGVVAAEEGRNANLKWFVVHVFSGYELRVKKWLEGPLALKFPGRVGKSMIPVEEVTLTRGAKRTTREKRLYPGYVFVELELNDEMVLDIRSMMNVSGFPPMNRSYPQPLSDEEMKRIIGQADGRETHRVVRVPFSVGQTVRVVDGPFNNFSGVVESINPERGRVRVIFTIFGRKAPVELDFAQVKLV
ncbi:MAG TPA: transcription termination/antitermination protein NusG [Candidatus Fermentibacter sp.]|jgi:transcription termination/antitermination protein NusG|nr:transcription termination/antitermination protein NusG [Candidatus Fermentibacter sp.]HRY60553.1 transcription termination/antitermination protein NusG [Candidatus Fermentibacter sp.]